MYINNIGIKINVNINVKHNIKGKNKIGCYF